MKSKYLVWEDYFSIVNNFSISRMMICFFLDLFKSRLQCSVLIFLHSYSTFTASCRVCAALPWFRWAGVEPRVWHPLVGREARLPSHTDQCSLWAPHTSPCRRVSREERADYLPIISGLIGNSHTWGRRLH